MTKVYMKSKDAGRSRHRAGRVKILSICLALMLAFIIAVSFGAAQTPNNSQQPTGKSQKADDSTLR